MSCTHYRTMDLRRERLHSDFKYSHSCYTTACRTSAPKNICFEANNRGDPPFPDPGVQMGGGSAHTYETARHWDSAPTIAAKMQMRLKLLEDTGAAWRLRSQSLIAENTNLARRLEEDAIEIENLRGNVTLLQRELDCERAKLTELLTEQTKKDEIRLEDECTSSTNIVPTTDRGIQIWETCKDCHEELEGCQRAPTVTITKSELELLERDMRILRDAVIAREVAWDKAMEREQNCRRQLARLTAEAITARQLCETRQDELRAVAEALTEKELELKTVQKEMQHLNTLIAKLHRYHRELEERAGSDMNVGISEKDRKCIEEIARRVKFDGKGKSRAKSKCTSDKYSHSNSISRHGSPRESNGGKDRAGSSEDHRN